MNHAPSHLFLKLPSLLLALLGVSLARAQFTAFKRAQEHPEIR